jgi:hypothetical protein
MSTYGEKHVVQNGVWSGAKLLNSCDEKLWAKIEEQVINRSGWVLTGPVFLKIMLDLILTSLAQSMRGFTEHFKSITPKDFDGENISEYVSFA